MRNELLRCTVAVAAAGVLLAGIATAQDFSTLRIATGLDRPVFLTAPPGDLGRVFVVEQHTGEILIMDLGDGSIDATPFLTLTGLSTGNEQGLLGLAFHPDYGVNGYFYVYFTDPSSNVVRYEVSGDPDVADASSETPVLGFSQPASNHAVGPAR